MAGNESFDLGLGRRERQPVTERLTDIQQGAPLAGEPKRPKTIQDISVETGVPWNVIETVVSDSGVAPDQGLALAQDFAHKMKQEIDAGKDVPTAMRSIFGDDAPVEEALTRAVDLAGGDQGRATSGQNNDNSFAEDAARSVAGGAITGIGAIAEGAGTLLDVDDLFGDPGITDWTETAGRAVAETLQGWGQNVKDGMSDDAKRAVRNSTPDGKLFEPSTWTFEGDVSPQGIALLTADVLGSLAPVVIAGVFTGGVGGAAVGGLQGAGAGAQTGREIVNRATPEQLEAHSGYYNELVDKGMKPEDAKAKVADAAASLSAVMAAPVAGAGGAFTGGLVSKGVGSLAGKSIGTRVAGTAGIAGAEEGTQEVLEGVFARTGAEVASGLPVDKMEGTFGEFVLGALGGGVIGAGRGALPTEQPEEAGEGETDAPLGLPAPDPQLPAPDSDAPDSLDRPALGNLARAAQAAPTPTEAPEPVVNAQSGQPVRVTMKNGMQVDAEFVGEDENGVSLKVNGDPALITRERMDQDGIQVEPVDVLAETAWADVETTPKTNFEPLDDTTEPQPARAERMQGALDTYLSEQKIDTTPEDRAEIVNSIDRLGGTVEQAVADFQADMQMEALTQETAQIAQDAQQGEAIDQDPIKSETPTEQGGSEVAPAQNQEPVKRLDGTAWGAMAPEQRQALLASVGFKDAQGNLNAPGRRAAGKEWDALSERVREKLAEQIDPQAQAGAPVAPGADPNRGIEQGAPAALEAPAESPARTQPGVNVLPDGEEPIAMPGSVAAAALETEEQPTDGQKEAENYRTGKAPWQGLNLSVENRKGTERSKKTPDGKTEWSVTMPAHYGRILRTEGADGDHVDFYMGDNEASENVWVIDQMDAETGAWDEHKVMLGFDAADQARKTYEAGFSDGKGAQRLGGIKKMTVADFKDWLANGDTKKPVTPKATRGDKGAQGQLSDQANAAVEPEIESTETATPLEDAVIAPTPEPAIEQSADDILNAAFDDVFGSEPEPEAAPQSQPEPQAAPPRTAGEAAQSAASNTAEGVGNIVDGLNALFGGANKLNSGLSFDRDTYEQAKPMFTAAVRAFGRAGQDVIDMAKAMVRGLSANGLTREAQENMRPYLTQFITDMREGEIDPFAEEVQTPPEDDTITPDEPETPDEQRGNQEGDQGEPESEEPQEGMGPVGEPDGEPNDDGRGEGDEDGAGEPARDDQDGSLGDGPGSVSDGPVDERQGTPPPNFVITDDFALGKGTDGEKLAANMAALRLADTLEKENRYATPDEQSVLARWVGWGGLKTVFDGKHEGTTTQWGRTQAELKELLPTDEYVAGMRSTNDAHYTSRTVVKAMWRAMRNFGFEGGRALEPTIGSGNFLGLQPADLSERTEWHAAELDPTTGRIAKHLYPEAQVFDGMGFQDAPFRRSAFDVAIGNPPFGSTKIGNKKLHPDLGKMSVHNFIIAKTGQLLREGGVMSMVVTHRFLDTPNPEARASLAPDFRFLGAIRLPNTAFAENANTEVTTDIVFFQKRREGETDNDTTWLETGAEGPNGTRLNRYFANNPDMILGRPAMDGTMYAGGRKEGGKGEFTVHADGRDLEASLNETIDRIEAQIPARDGALEDATTARENSSSLPYGAMMLAKDGRIYRGEEDSAGNRVVQEVTEDSYWKDSAEAQGRVVETLRAALDAKKAPTSERLDMEQEARDAALEAGLVDMAGDPVKQKTKYETALSDNLMNLLVSDAPRKDAKDALEAYSKVVDSKRLGTDGFARLSAMLDLRQRTRELIALERADADSARLDARRRGLRNAYRKFQKKHGYINNSKNEATLRGDVGPEFALELGYKAATKDGRKETAREAPILEKRVIYPHKLPDNVANVSDGLHVSMQERGHIDPGLIASLTGKPVDDVIEELVSGAEPLAFRNPKSGQFEMAEVYLSGNLAEKIREAQDAGVYQNVPHLKNAMPPPKEQDQITPSIRSLWLPPSVFNDFLRAMGYARPNVTLLEGVGMASVDAGTSGQLTEFGQQFETDRMTPAAIFEHAIKGKIPAVFDTVRTPEGDKRVKNEPATREAVTAYERMTKEFPEWAYANPERAGQIVDAFNEKMNVVTERAYQGVRYLRMVGNSPEIDLRNSQKDGAWRMIQDKVSLLHHVVGAGKTFTAIAGVMERKRMGLTRKAVVAVPNHLTGQWGREWLELYPAANILVPTEKDFEPANRSKLINRIATGDFDAVIIGHSQLTKIENDPEISRKYISEQIDELNAALQEAKRSGESKRTVGQIGTRLTKLKEKLDGLEKKLAERADDRVIGWQDLGVDYMVVDEAHLFKNLEYTTTATQLVGMNPPGGSQRAFDMLMKVRALQNMQSGGVSFLTGTPVSNSLVEIYAMMKYLIPESLESMNIQSFDSWKAAFIQDQSRFEYTASMQLKERNIMSGMINLGPLAQLYRSFADIVMRPDVERMFTEQMEARNAAEPDPDKQAPTRFPTPKIKGGERRISLAPPTPKMQEFVRYLVMRMAGIKKNKSNKDYMSIDNALWVLTDARKASVDIRTIDPTLGREEGSKVERASAEVFRLWEENAERKGTQMVFSDMSAPTKAAEAGAKRILKAAYEKLGLKGAALTARTKAEEGQSYAERWGNVIEEIDNIISSPDTDEKRRDRLVEFSESEAAQDASAAMFTADTGFSFYDDMKAALIEKGVPEKEIAFIHDYDTTVKKAALFEAVNEGRIRVLIGSTQKMGAGTNAQKRMVALHHIDAPWRPSDMEQREGRIIRQGNLFYEQDPEGFEVEIIAYSTEQTADVVQWQVLERKAASIETFLNAATDSIEEEGGDADQYAEFMAQSTGKEVFLQKMQAEKDRDTEQAKIASTLRNLTEADRFIAAYDRSQQLYTLRSETFASVSADTIGEGADTYLSEWEAEAAQYRADKDRIEAERDEVRKRNAEKPRKEWEKLPELPSAPSRWEERPAGGWERKVYDALSRAQSMGSEVEIPLNDGFKITISAKGSGGGVVSYAPYLTPPNNAEVQAEVRLVDGWGTIDAKDFRRSDKLLNALSPANILSRAEDRAAAWSREQKRHSEILPQMQEIKENGVDRGPLEAAQTRLDRLSALVRIEEVKFATETAGAGPNYFALRDDKGRDLVADDTAEPLTGQFQFTNAGQNYSSEWGAPGGTRRIEGTDRSGQVAYFEAENMDTGEQVIIEAIQTKAAEGETSGEWDVLNVFDAPVETVAEPEAQTPDKSADEMSLDDDGNPNVRASKSNLKARRADFDAAAGDTITSAPEARKAMRKVRRALRDELARFGIGANITLDVREGVIDNFPGIGAMDGYFLDGVIGIAADTPGGYMGVLRHEVIHALRNPQLWGKDHGLFTANEWRTLVRAARRNTRLMDQVAQDYDGLSETDRIEEVIAEMFREWMETQETQTALGRAFDKLRQILDAIVTALRGQGLNDAAAVFEKVRSGEIGGRGPEGPGRVTRDEQGRFRAKIATPRDVAQITAKTRNMRAGISQLASDAVTNAMKDRGGYNTLALVPGRALFKELGRAIPAAQKYLALKEKMDTKRNDKHAETDVVAQKWRKLINKNPDANAELMTLMHDSTIAGVDPSERFVSPMEPRDPDIIKAGRVANPIAYEAALDRQARHEKMKSAHDDLAPRFKALPKDFQDMYREVRDTYRRLDDEQTAAIIGNVERAMTLAIRRAEREHRRTVETAEKNHAGTLSKINADKTLSGTERATKRAQAKMKLDEAIKDADEALAKAKATRAWSRDSQVRSLRAQFETNRLSGPYFPLARFGEYFVLARDAEGNVQSFSRHETVQQQRAAEKDMKDEGFEVQIGVMQEVDARDLVDPVFVADIERMLEEVNADEKLMDDIWQRWLESLPDMSIRKHRIHRKNREGYDADALRAFGHHMFHGSHQLARLLYSLEMQEELDVASEEAGRSEDPVRKGFIVNEMKRRHAFTMNPKGAWWASRATSLAFVYYLSVSPAAAMVNLSQTSIVGTAVLGRFGGTRKAAGALTKALADFTRSPNWHSEKNTKNLSADERAAMNEAYKRGTIDRTQSHDLAQVAESGVEYNAKWVNVMSKISWLFHHSERMNREVTFLAGYRLLREQGRPHEQAITEAGNATWETHFDYQNTSKPRVMQSPGMQVLLTFRNFTVNLLWRIFRDLHQSVNAESKEERKEARRQAAVMASTMLFHAGIKGMYGYGLVMALLGMFFPDDEDDPEERLEKLMLDYLPRPMAKAMLDGVPGTLGGINLTSRIGMANLWFREPLRPLEGADLYQHYVNEVLGPIPAIGMNMATGANRVIDGAKLRDGSLVWRGVETAMPKAMRDVMKSGRYAYEGALTYNGDPIKDDFSAWEVIAQASGFTPKELSDRYDQNGRLKNKERAITDRRRNVIKQVAEQIKAGKNPTPRQLRLIEDFNRDYPEWPISSSTITRSVQGRINRSERNEAGVSINPRLEPRLRGSLSPLVADG